LDFFFDFDFFAFFAFFAFLAIASSFGLMEGNATRGMLGGGPASQHPRMQSQQIRGALPRTVTALSLRYPQLICVLARFSQNFGAMTPCKRFPAPRIASLGVNDAPTRRRICTDPEGRAPPSSPSSSFQHHSLDCSAAVRVR
jgi:hypothetical protein